MTMETKQDVIKEMSQIILRILNKHARLESLPVYFGDMEITHRELHMIQAIGDHDMINITELGSHFGITKSAASQMVTKLLRKGFIKKELSVHSNKEYQLSLSDSGQTAYQLHETFHGKHMSEIVERLGAFSLTQIATTSVLLEIIDSVVTERIHELIGE